MRRLSLLLLLCVAFAPAVAQQPFSVARDDRGVAELLQQLVFDRQNETVHCETDGDEGRRVLAAYLSPGDQPDDFTGHIVDIRRALGSIDDVWDAAADPYDQHPRWACDPDSAKPVVWDLRGPPLGADGTYTFAEVVNALRKANMFSSDRVYVVFVDHLATYPYGGQATVRADDRAAASNLNNVGPSYAMIDAQKQAWSHRGLFMGGLHELLHTLGAVQCSAPHSSCPRRELGHFHCWDGTDVMCYDDGGSYYAGPDGISGTADDRTVSGVCAPRTDAEQIDCGRDDYFNVNPDAGSYLATHWNVTHSSFVTPLFLD
jgi:hypothetical protein